jgi:hypothetical protein
MPAASISIPVGAVVKYSQPQPFQMSDYVPKGSASLRPQHPYHQVSRNA